MRAYPVLEVVNFVLYSKAILHDTEKSFHRPPHQHCSCITTTSNCWRLVFVVCAELRCENSTIHFSFTFFTSPLKNTSHSEFQIQIEIKKLIKQKLIARPLFKLRLTTIKGKPKKSKQPSLASSAAAAKPKKPH